VGLRSWWLRSTRRAGGGATCAREAAFGASDHSQRIHRRPAVGLPSPFVRHHRDPSAVVLRPWNPARRLSNAGAWAAKLGSHTAHHRFGSFGRLPHLQLNVWRVGIKGSGRAVRIPVVSLGGVALAVTQLIP